MAESIYGLEVVVSMYDKLTAPLKNISSALTYASKQAKLMQQSMRIMGAGGAELQALQKQMDSLAKSNTFSKLASDMKAAGASAGQIDLVAQGLNKVADAQARISSGKSLLTKGGLSIGLGVGLLAGSMYEPIKQAMEMQQSMMGVKIATGANPAQLQQLTQQAMLGALQTGISSNMVASVQTALAQTKLPLNDILNPQLFNQYLKFSDMNYQRNGTDVQTSTKVAMEASHMFGLYNNPKQLSSFLNQMWKTAATSPIPLQNIGNILSYFGGTANGVGLSANSSLAMVNYLATSGLAGSGKSGGSDLMQYIQHAMNPATEAAETLMKKYGLMSKSGASVFYKNGHFADLQQQIEIMQNFSKQFGGNKQAMIGVLDKIFATTGGRYALSLSESNAPSLYKKITSSTNAVANIDTAQGMQMNTVAGQLSRLKQGFKDMMVGLGLQQLSSVMNLLKSINGTISKIVNFEVAHPLFMKSIGNVIKLTAAALIFRGTVMSIAGAAKIFSGAFQLTRLFGDFARLGGSAKFLIDDFGVLGGTMNIAGRAIMLMGGWIGRITGLTKVWGVVTAVTSAIMEMTPIGWLITGIAALIAVIVLVVTHWKTCVKWLQTAVNWFKHLGIGAQAAIALIMPIVGIPAMIISHWSGIVKFFDGIWSHISPIIQSVGKFMGFTGGSNLISPSTASATQYMSSGTTNIHIHSGAIQVNGASDPHAVATQVVGMLGQGARLNNTGSAFAPNKLALR